MCAIQRNFGPNQQTNQQTYQQPHQPPPVQEQQQRERYRFRWPIYLGIPAVVIAFLWFIGGMEVGFEFFDISEALEVVATDRYVLLACLGISCVTSLLIVKALKKNR